MGLKVTYQLAQHMADSKRRSTAASSTDRIWDAAFGDREGDANDHEARVEEINKIGHAPKSAARKKAVHKTRGKKSLA